MYYLGSCILLIFPFLTFLLLVIGLKTERKNYILAALWLSLIASILHYQTANGEILGSYFDYWQALIYSMNLTVLLLSLMYFIIALGFETSVQSIRYALSLLAATLIIAVTILLANIWFNAWFLSDRMPNTPLLQVATSNKLDYCNYKYVFYKVSSAGTVDYMCPQRFGVLPSRGVLDRVPKYILKQLPIHLQIKFKRDTLEKNSLGKTGL